MAQADWEEPHVNACSWKISQIRTADKVVITGRYNFSENAELNDENILIIQKAAAAAAYTKYFDALFKVYQKTGPKLPVALLPEKA